MTNEFRFFLIKSVVLLGFIIVSAIVAEIAADLLGVELDGPFTGRVMFYAFVVLKGACIGYILWGWQG